MIAELKSYFKYLIFLVVDRFVGVGKKDKQKRLMLIKTDAIGDYVLFRNFLSILAQDDRYQDYQLTLLGNSAWRSIAEELDFKTVNTFIWLDKRKFDRNPIYRFRRLRQICSTYYDVVINPVYSREFIGQDMVVGRMSANHKIGSSGNAANLYNWQKKLADRKYTKLIPATPGNLFEFERNKEFFERLLDRKISLKKPFIKPDKKWVPIALKRPFALLFIGASQSFRKWPIDRYAELAAFLGARYGLSIVLCGGPTDSAESKRFQLCYTGNYIDLVGKTTLLELMGLVQNAEIMISNETAAPHFAVALGVPNIFVISNGNYFGRFTPYPQSIGGNYHAVFPPQLSDVLSKFDLVKSPVGFKSDLPVSDIAVERVIQKVESHFVKTAVS